MARLDIAFEGGGMKGVAFAGALEVLHEQGYQWGRLVGTSAGAVAAVLCAAGYEPNEIRALLGGQEDHPNRVRTFFDIPEPEEFTREEKDNSLTMSLFATIKVPCIPDAVLRRVRRFLLDLLLTNGRYARLFNFVERGGFYVGRAFQVWVEERLAAKGLPRQITFGGLYEETGIDVSVTAADLVAMDLLVLNRRTAPELPVAWAVRMSMGIPFIWQPVVWQKEWGTYCAQNVAGHLIVDGGVLSNFPIWLLTGTSAQSRELMGSADNQAFVLGLLIDEQLPVPGVSDQLPSPSFTRVPVIDRTARLVEMVWGARDREAIRQHEHLICRLPAKGYGTLDFNLGGDRLERLLIAARQAMVEHLKSRGLYQA